MANFFRSRSSLFARAFLTTTTAVVVLFAVTYLLSVPFIQTTVENIEERATRTVLDNVYEMVAQIHRDIEDTRQSVLLARKSELINIAAVVESRAAWLDRQVRAGKLGREQAKRMLLDELLHIHYGRNDYVFAADYRSVLVSHPDPKLNGADFSDVRDTRGNLIVPPMVEGARKSGAGFHSYWWRRLNEEQPIEKLSFYTHLPAFKLVIGTGVYIDDIDTVLNSRRAVAVEELRQRLNATRIARTGYLYIFDGRYRMLIHPNANIEGKDASGTLDPATRKPLFPMLAAVADKGEGLRYKWDSPANPGNYVYDKISWVRYFKDMDWYIGSSVYVDELDESARVLRNRVLTVFALTLSFAVGLIYIFVERLVGPLRHLSATASRVEGGDLGARCVVEREDEIGVVTKAFNGMVDRLQNNIGLLDARVRGRTAELEAANEELKQLDELKSNFLSSVSHELRTPMTSVVGFSQLVKKKLENVVFPRVATDEQTTRAMSQVRANLDIIIAESERLTLLINDVLDSAKLDAGTMEWNLVPLEPARLIERVAQVARLMVTQKGLTLELDVAGDLPAIRGDRDRLYQVLINLVSNAVKFTERGTIVLRAARTDGFVRFDVVDSGIGIAAEYRETVFDTFSQIGDTLTDKPQGTGLGLSICRQIVRHHGGDIGMDSMPGKGTTFHFTVPIIA